MKVRLLTNMYWPPGTIAPADSIVDLPEEMADDWIKRELAEPVTPAPAPEPTYKVPKGKR